MEVLLEHITKVEQKEMGVKEFQVAVLSALLSIMKEQESLNRTLQHLTNEANSKETLDTHMDLFSDDSSDEEHHGKGKPIYHSLLLEYNLPFPLIFLVRVNAFIINHLHRH